MEGKEKQTMCVRENVELSPQQQTWAM